MWELGKVLVRLDVLHEGADASDLGGRSYFIWVSSKMESVGSI